MTEVRSAGLPHSEIHGSMDICSSPWLFAAYHVFRRRSVPRHSPCALCHLTFFDALVHASSSRRFCAGILPAFSVASPTRSLISSHCLLLKSLSMKLIFLFSFFRCLSLSSICSFQGAIYIELTLRQLLSEVFLQPPALPYRLQYSTIGRLWLNRRVRHGNGCFP